METNESIQINMFNINSEVYIWKIERGLPSLIKCRVKCITLYQRYICYEILTVEGEDEYSIKEENIFKSIEEAVTVYNEATDILRLSIKGQ